MSIWLSWLANRTTSTPIGLGLLFMVISVGVLAVGASLILLESSLVKDLHRHTPVQGIALTTAATVAAVSGTASMAVTYLHFITDASRGFFAAAADYPPATALWCVALPSFTAWVSIMAAIARH